MNEGRGAKAPFRGYSSPNYTPVPDELFDEQLPDLSGAELKVLLYIIRRTFGFKRESDNISLSQMLNGLRTRDGRVLDRGVGLSKKTLLQAIKSLEEQEIILTERRRSQEKGDEPTSYRLNVQNGAAAAKTSPPVGEKVHHGGGELIPPRGRGKKSPTQETVRQKTDFDLSKFERSHDQNEQEHDARQSVSTNAHQVLIQAQAGEGTSPTRLGTLLTRRRQKVTRPQSRRPIVAASEDRERLRPFLEDFARELGDESPLSSTITRVLGIFQTAGVAPERWSDLLYQARGLTQERTPQIRKRAGSGEDQFRQKNKMPYFLAVLEQLVGLRPDGERSSQDIPQ